MSRRVRALAPLGLLAALAIAWQLPEVGWLRLAAGDAADAEPMTDALEQLPEAPTVLVGFDPDIGTYPETRPTVRALLADLLARDSGLAFVSLTVEGRALATAELTRLARARVDGARLLDLGFIPGAEAGLVDLSGGIPVPDTGGEGGLAGQVAGEGIGAFDAIAIVGGNDLGPRSWVEQVAPRIDEIPIVALVPTVLLPQVQPYVASGQLAALLATPADGAAYRAGLDLGDLEGLVDPAPPRPLPLLVGMLIAIAVLGQALGTRVLDLVRATGARDTT